MTEKSIPAITFKNLSKTYKTGFLFKKVHSVQNLNLAINQGEIVGYIGPNGSGKTTTFKLLLGLVKKTSGAIEFFGQEVNGHQYKSNIGYLPENPYYYNFLTGEELLKFHGGMYNIKSHIMRERIDYLLDLVGLQHARTMLLKSYSRGMLQRIGIAQALINNPKVLILDEPMSGLDPFGRKEIRDIILSCKEMGKTVVFSSHILSDVEALCDSVAIIFRGRLQEYLNVKDVVKRDIDYWEIVTESLPETLIGEYTSFGGKFISTKDSVISQFSTRELAVKFLGDLENLGIMWLSFNPHREGLEELFVKHTKAQ